MKSISFSLLSIITLALIGLEQTGWSQEAAKKNAVIAFDIRGSQLVETETFKKIFTEGSIISMFTGTTVMPQRIFGASSLPDDFAFLQAPAPPKELPFDFFARITMKDKDEAEELADIFSNGAEETEISGKKFSVVGPRLLIHQPDEKSIEAGNQAYIIPKSRRVFTPRLTKAFAATPNVPIRIAMDLESQKQSVAQMVDLQIQQLDGLDPGIKGVVEAFLNCLKNLSEVRIGIGLKSENLLSIEAVGYDEAKATEFKEALDSVIGLAQFSRKPIVDTLRGQSKQLADDVNSIIQNAKATVDGTKVSLVVPAPLNFDKTLAGTIDLEFGFGPGAAAGSMAVETEYDRRPIPEFDSSKKLSELEDEIPEQLKKSCFPGSFWGDRLRVDVDPIDLPNVDLYEFRYKVVSVKSKDGKLDLLGEGDGNNPVDKPQKLWMSSTRGAHIEVPITLKEVKLESTKGKNGKDLSSRQMEELKKAQIGSAEVEVIVSGADAVTVFELTQDNPKQEKGGVRAKLASIKGSSATVTYKGDSVQIYAFDETGKRLRQQGSSGSTGRKSAFFAGQPKKVTAVVLSGQKKTITCPVTIDLNGGKRIELPNEPSDDVPIRYSLEQPKDYKSVSQAEMDALEVKHDFSDGRFGPRRSFYVDFPSPDAEIQFNWDKRSFFGEKTELTIKNAFPNSNGQKIALDLQKPHDAEMPDIRRAFGEVVISGSTGVELLTFDKQSDGEELKSAMASGKEFLVTFNKHHVSFSRTSNIIQLRFYDKAGRLLKFERARGNGPGLDARKCWGIPEKAEFLVRGGQIKKTLSYEKKIGEVDEQAYQNFKKQVKRINEVGQELVALNRIAERADCNLCVAGMFYVHKRNSDEPLNLVSEQIAQSDPKGAEMFDYEAKPYKGYYFTFPDKFLRNNKETPRIGERLKKSKMKWAGGEIENVRRVNSHIASQAIALPADPKDPVIFVNNFSQVYSKVFEDGKLDVLPDHNQLREWTPGPQLSQQH